VRNPGWVASRGFYLLALRDEFENRDYDYSAILNMEGFSLKNKVNSTSRSLMVNRMGALLLAPQPSRLWPQCPLGQPCDVIRSGYARLTLLRPVSQSRTCQHASSGFRRSNPS
jgi:hypothetical protein